MDLKAILAANKAKTVKSNLTIRNPVKIAVEDRPYSIEPAPFIEKETDNKVATKWQQTDNKTDNKVATNRQQTDNKKEIQNQNWQQSGNETDNITDNKVVTKYKQTGNKLATKAIFSELVGLQRNIIIFICFECKNSRSRTTEALTLEHISTSLKRSTGAIKTTIQRLEKKGCLTRVGFKNGRGGWSKYEVPDHIYHDVLRLETDNKLTTKWQQTDNKVASQPATEPATKGSSSSSLNNITTTNDLDDQWNFDIVNYACFGFTLSHLKQLAKLQVISAFDVEQSLIEFNYDFENNALPRIKTNKINFLMGLLRAGHSYISETYRNEQEQMITLMAERVAQKKKTQLEEKFVVWESQLSNNDRKTVVSSMSPSLMVLYQAHGLANTDVKKHFFDYFLNKSFT
jgi:hypothetical protein